MTRHLWLRAASFAFFVISGASCLRDVSLEVVPEVVQRGQEVILRCHYDLEAPLYSLKWYRGKHEFYRYAPGEEQATKVFNITGTLYVDAGNSNKSQVTLLDVDFALSGTFSCEVTVDATFFTASASKNLTVVSLPKEAPTIVSERERYDAGDTLRANCSLPPSKPAAHLSFTLNNVAVDSYKKHQPQEHPQQRWDHNDAAPHADQPENLQWIEIRVNLQPFHYSNGQLNLRCNAQIPGIYSEISEVRLGAGLREPVPERVTSENGSEAPAAVYLTMLMLCMLQLFLR